MNPRHAGTIAVGEEQGHNATHLDDTAMPIPT